MSGCGQRWIRALAWSSQSGGQSRDGGCGGKAAQSFPKPSWTCALMLHVPSLVNLSVPESGHLISLLPLSAL